MTYEPLKNKKSCVGMASEDCIRLDNSIRGDLFRVDDVRSAVEWLKAKSYSLDISDRAYFALLQLIREAFADVVEKGEEGSCSSSTFDCSFPSKTK